MWYVDRKFKVISSVSILLTTLLSMWWWFNHYWVQFFVTPWTVGSSVHGIFQARILEWVTISFSRVSSQPTYQTQIFYTGRRIPYGWVTREATMDLCCCLIAKSCGTLYNPWTVTHQASLLMDLRVCVCVCAKSLQSCLTLCNPMDCILPVSFSVGFSRQEYWWGCCALLQRIFPTQGSNPGLYISWTGSWALYPWCHLGSLSMDLYCLPNHGEGREKET